MGGLTGRAAGCAPDRAAGGPAVAHDRALARALVHSTAVQHAIPHDLDLELAKKAARKAVEAYGEQFKDYAFSADWKGDSKVDIGFTVTGRRLEGSLSVLADKMLLELQVPFIFRVFSGRAIAIIEREANVWIEKARKGELA